MCEVLRTQKTKEGRRVQVCVYLGCIETLPLKMKSQANKKMKGEMLSTCLITVTLTLTTWLRKYYEAF